MNHVNVQVKKDIYFLHFPSRASLESNKQTKKNTFFSVPVQRCLKCFGDKKGSFIGKMAPNSVR